VDFVDKTIKMLKTNADLPILVQEKLPTSCVCAEGVIIADKSLSKEERLIVDQCLEFNYKVYIVPSLQTGKIKRDFKR
jgi:hypothetical protein